MFKVKTDPNMPKDQVRFVDDDGKEVGRIVNVATDNKTRIEVEDERRIVDGEPAMILHCLVHGLTLCGIEPLKFTSKLERWTRLEDWRSDMHREHVQPCMECLKIIVRERPPEIYPPKGQKP